jgi:Family of unknown function (DUF5681)
MAKQRMKEQDAVDSPTASGEPPVADNNKVGYRRPPRHTRFKKGQSGNPRGRPQGGANAKTIVSRVIGEKVTLREGDKPRAMTKLEGLLQAHLVKAIKGDARSAGLVINLVTRLGLLAETENKTITALSEEDHAILDDYVRSKTGPAVSKAGNEKGN